MGWIFFGLMLNTAIDIAAVCGLLGGIAAAIITTIIIAGFIAILYAAGHWQSLKARFLGNVIWEDDQPLCTGCRCNLTGNLSGVCPEFGKAINLEPAISLAQWSSL